MTIACTAAGLTATLAADVEKLAHALLELADLAKERP
jgi:hypothetical protein